MNRFVAAVMAAMVIVVGAAIYGDEVGSAAGGREHPALPQRLRGWPRARRIGRLRVAEGTFAGQLRGALRAFGRISHAVRGGLPRGDS